MPLKKAVTHGFTLVELIVSMAIYAVVLAMLGIIVVSFAGLYEKTLDETGLHDQTLKIHSFITSFYEQHNGSVVIDTAPDVGDPFFSYTPGVGDPETVSFQDNTLYYGTRIMASHEDIDTLVVAINTNATVITLRDSTNTILHTIILINSAGNTILV